MTAEVEQLIDCPCCGRPIQVTLSEDGLIKAVLFDMQNPDTVARLNESLDALGYVFGTKEGGEIDE